MRPTTSQSADGVSQAAGSQTAGSQAAGSQAAGSRAPGSRARGRRTRRSRGLAVAYLLAAATASALVIDAVVHFQDAYFYDANTGALLSQGQLFRIQAGVALVAALGVLAFPKRWPVWLFAALVAGSAAAAVIAYTYIDIGALAGLPNMYEPSWGPPGKLASAIAEIAGRPRLPGPPGPPRWPTRAWTRKKRPGTRARRLGTGRRPARHHAAALHNTTQPPCTTSPSRPPRHHPAALHDTTQPPGAASPSAVKALWCGR